MEKTRKHRFITDEDRKNIHSLLEEGKSISEVSRLLNIARPTIYVEVKKGNYPVHHLKKKRKFTDEDRKNIHSLLEEGKNLSEVSLLLNIAGATVYEEVKRGNYPVHRLKKHRKLTDEDRKNIHSLLEEGKSISEVSLLLNIPRSTVDLEVKRGNYPTPKQRKKAQSPPIVNLEKTSSEICANFSEFYSIDEIPFLFDKESRPQDKETPPRESLDEKIEDIQRQIEALSKQLQEIKSAKDERLF